jgi:hypothetical protein
MSATFEQYQKLIEDRPEKFTPEEVHFRKATVYEPKCAGCLHWFFSPMRADSVCEIMRPDTGDSETVPSWFTCKFQTSDGKDFPLLEG